MTECQVICTECGDKKAKVWRWLCETCAEECQQEHRRQTGHQPELRIVTEAPSIGRLMRMAERASKVVRR